MILLSDSYRPLKIAVFTALVLGLCLYNYRVAGIQTAAFHAYFESPGEGDGRVLPFPYAKVLSENDGTVEVWIKGHIYRVDTGERRFGPGTKVSFTARKTGPDRVKMLHCHVHRMHKLKLYVSFIPMLVIFYLIGRRYRFDFRRLMFTERT